MDTKLSAPITRSLRARSDRSWLRGPAASRASIEPEKFGGFPRSYNSFAEALKARRPVAMLRLLQVFAFLTAIALQFCSHPQRAYCQREGSDNYRSTTEAWQHANSERLKGPNGWLALTAHLWLDSNWLDIGSDPTMSGSLGADPPNGLHVQASGNGNEVRVKMLSDHSLSIASTDPLTSERPNQGTTQAMGPFVLKVPLGLDAECPERLVLANRYVLQAVRRNGRLALRIRDPESSAIKEFPGKFWFPIDPAFVVNATFTAYPASKWVNQKNIRGEEAGVEQVGEIAFQLNGISVQWIVQTESDDEHLIVFRDATCGQGSYPACRFLNFQIPALDRNGKGSVQLDFNRSYNPPCAFSSQTLCPLPPKQNEIGVPIPVGERYATRDERLARMQKVMGRLPDSSRVVPLDIEWKEREKMDGYDRIRLTYASEAGDRVPAWLLVPQGTGPFPAMLCLHQTISIGKNEPVGLGEQESKRQALHLVKRGYVCLAPDYPSFGEYPFDFQKAFQEGRFESGTMKAIWNNMRAVDLLGGLPEVDAKRIGVIGHSLGGHNALFTASFDPRLKVAVTSCGFCSFHKYYGGSLKGWTSDRYMPKIASEYGNDPKRMPFDFDDVLLSIYPRAIFVMAPQHDANFDVSGVQDVLAKVEPSYVQGGIGNRIQAIFPDAGHEWPEKEREAAYRFVDSVLKE